MSEPAVDRRREEAERLTAIFAGNPAALLGLLSSQLAVLKQQGQMLTGLSAIAITVTGFSGSHMVQAGGVIPLAMSIGIAFILAGVLTTLRTLGRLRWVTQDLADDLTDTAVAVIERRDREQQALGRAGMWVAAGLASYLVAVCLAAFAAH